MLLFFIKSRLTTEMIPMTAMVRIANIKRHWNQRMISSWLFLDRAYLLSLPLYLLLKTGKQQRLDSYHILKWNRPYDMVYTIWSIRYGENFQQETNVSVSVIEQTLLPEKWKGKFDNLSLFFIRTSSGGLTQIIFLKFKHFIQYFGNNHHFYTHDYDIISIKASMS